MKITARIIGLVLVSWAARTSFAQSSSCSWQRVTAYASHNTTITSPNYPFNYDDKLECAWLITVDNSLPLNGYIVQVTFDDFSLEGSLASCEDVLKFYDSGSASYLLGSYCGTTHPEVIYSSWQNLYVKFQTDFGVTKKGFRLMVSAVKKEEASGICFPWDRGDTVHSLNSTSGTFFSPGYPFPYPPYVYCIWTISVPASKAVKLKFEDLDLETTFDSCNQQSTNKIDYVKIGNGKDPKSNEFALYCGYQWFSSRYPEMQSTGRDMWIKFDSNWGKNLERNSNNNRGFKARFEAVDISPIVRQKCFLGNINNNDLKLTGSHGTLQSPNEPNPYPPGSSCDWLITVPDGKIVKLSFDRFQLESSYGSSCTADYVEVLDGRNNNSKSKGRFCGYSTPDDIHSSGRYMWVRFRADSSRSYQDGFKATFSAEDKPTLALIIGVVVGVIVFIAIVCCIVCVVKRKKKPSGSAGASIAMSAATTTTASHTTQPGVIQHSPPAPVQPPSQPPVSPYPPPPVDYAPGPANSSLSAAPNPYPPYPSEPPPPYPGNETVPQYPPPGQSYPWLQSAPVKASAPPEGS